MTEVLLTFTGFKDPFWDDPSSGGEVEGPILSLVRARPFDRVVLFATPFTERHTAATLRALRERFPSVAAELIPIDLDDPTSYAEILDGLRAHLPDIRRENDGAVFFIGTASGTPQMHASWLLLVASGELPAHLLHIRPPRFVDQGKVLVSEIEIDPARFPVIRPPSVVRHTLEGEQGKTLSAVVEQLGIVGDHPKLQAALEAAALLAQSDVPVLILGESGTGKEKVAELIHRMSARAKKPFEKVNCAAIPESLAESMLFGHEKGAFTGAERANPGAFDAADGGTLFLDEFAELPMPTQAKLLRALPRQGERLGPRASRPRGGRGEDPTRARCPRSQAGAVGEPRLRNSPQHPPTRPADGTPALPGEHRGWHSRGYLPHFDGPFVTQAITFNLFDAIPARVIAAWKAELDITEATPADDPRHVELRGRIAQYEDQGHGSCFMRDARIADLVENALLHFDGERYRLLAWCVMPNHVHAIAVILDGHPLDQVVFSWKSFTAKAANKLLGRTGRFWMPEYFDRYIRDQRHFDKAVAYVEQNPVKAHLCSNPEDWPWSSARRRLT